VAEVQRTITEVQLQDAVYRADAAAAPPLYYTHISNPSTILNLARARVVDRKP
jgi:hypothetical protein